MSERVRADPLRFDDLRRLLRLALDLRDLPTGSELQRRHALEGLCALVGAQVGLWTAVDGIASGQVIMRDALDYGWASARGSRIFRRHVEDTQWTVPDPSMPALARAARPPFCTFTRDELLDARAWYRSEHVQEQRREAGVDGFIYSAYLPARGGAFCFSLHRPWGDRPFSARERGIVDAFHRECAFIHPVPPAAVARAARDELPPRLRDTLVGLAAGLSEKQIAAKLRLSQHTVHDYVKALHRRFGVQSRGELLARCHAPRERAGAGPS